MTGKNLNIMEDKALASLSPGPSKSVWQPAHNEWIRILRTTLRMTQSELAARARLSQSHIVAIESGMGDIQIGTLKKVFKALSCDLSMKPLPEKPLDEILKGRARAIALKRLKQSMGTMALERQAPEDDDFLRLLEKKTNEILNDRREKLWNKSDEG